MPRPSVDRRVSTYESGGVPIAHARVAKAKVNLALHVTGRRGDGYHELDTVAVFAEHGDTLSLASGKPARFVAEGPFAGALPPEGENLAARAMDALRHAVDQPDLRTGELLLFKDLPVSSGLGGGSSDAAAAMVLLQKGAQLDLDDETLFGAAEGLGSDVPMCLVASALRARGRGETMEPLQGFPTLHLVLVNPGVALSTAEVFAGLEPRERDPIEPDPSTLRTADDVLGFLARTRNDLQRPAVALKPEIGRVLSALEALESCRFARMSGAGATCFGLFEDRLAARRATMALRKAEPDWWVVPTKAA